MNKLLEALGQLAHPVRGKAYSVGQHQGWVRVIT